MKKIALVIISILLLSGLAYGKEAPKDGIIKEYYGSGQLKSVTNKEDGTVKNYNENGQLEYEGIFKDKDSESGIYKTYESGRLKQESGFKFEGEDIKRDGIYKIYYESGQLKTETNFKNDKEEGTAKKYYENGQVEIEMNYRNGKIEGVVKNYYESGQLEKLINFRNGKQNGIAKEFNESGQLMREVIYKDGKLIEQKDYDGEGNLVSRRG